MSKCWIGVAAADHIARGLAGGFMQVNHGKEAPLKRIRPGDIICCYSPTVKFGGKEKLMAFTALGRVREGVPYQGVMAGDFKPFRRDVAWFETQHAYILPLLQQLSFTKGQKSWGFKFRFGLFDVPGADMQSIAKAMACSALHISEIPG